MLGEESINNEVIITLCREPRGKILWKVSKIPPPLTQQKEAERVMGKLPVNHLRFSGKGKTH